MKIITIIIGCVAGMGMLAAVAVASQSASGPESTPTDRQTSASPVWPAPQDPAARPRPLDTSGCPTPTPTPPAE